MGESQIVQPSDENVEDGQKKSDPVVFEDHFSLWCLKMSVFFKKVFFPRAEKQQLLNKLAQGNM